MKNIYLLFDVPYNRNDKQWLFDGLSRLYSGHVVSVNINSKLSQLIMIKGGVYRILAYWIILKQCLRAIYLSEPDDIIICWFSTTGKIFNAISRFLGNKRYIVSMNWLNPGCKKSGFHYRLAKYAMTNKRCTIVVNAYSSPKRWNEFMLNNRTDYLVIPDVYDDTVTFEKPISEKNKTYFSGGYGNRDWHLLMSLASLLPQSKFICVAKKSDFYSKVQESEIPSNVELHFNTSEEEYYNLMKSTYVVLLPLLGNTISGLVNIIRAAQYGLLCCVSRTISTEQYYSKLNEDLLIGASDDNWQEEVITLESISCDNFLIKNIEFQNYIRTEFSPKRAISVLVERINKY